MKVFNVVILVIILSIVKKGNCGVINDSTEAKNDSGVIRNVYGKVKNTVIVVKDDIKSWWSYGKGLVFGNDEENLHDKCLNEEKHAMDIAKAELDKDRGVYQKVKNGVLAVRKKIHDVILGEENDDPKKGFVRNMYDRVLNRASKVKVYILGDDNELNPNGAIHKVHQNFTEGTKLIREGISKVLFGNGAKHLDLNLTDNYGLVRNNLEDSMTNTEREVRDSIIRAKSNIDNVNKNVEDEIDKVRETVKTSIDNVNKDVRDATRKEQDLMDNVHSKINDRVNKINDDVKNIGDSMELLS